MKKIKLSPLEKFTIDNCWDIRFFDKAGNADVAMAKKAFEWCKEEYPEWFSEETPFVLEHNHISWNSDEYSDDVDYSEIPSASPDSWCDCSPEDWLQQVGDGIDAEIIIAEFIKNDMEEEAESYYKSVVYENGKANVVDKFNFNGAAALRLEEYGGNDCETPGFALNPKTFKDYKGKFRNKKTGEEKLSGSVTGSVYEDEDGDVFWKMEFELNGEKSYVYDSSDYFVDALDKFIEESYHFDEDFADNLISNFADEEGLDEDGWEFVGFDSEPSIIESYFENQADNGDYEEESDDEEFDDEEFLDDEDYEDDEVLDGTDDEDEESDEEDQLYDEEGEEEASEGDSQDDEDEEAVECSEIFEIKKNVLTWIDPSVSGRIVIPSGVTRISTAFNSLMTEVVIPDTVIIISKYAFHRCTNLEKINIPASVKKIGEGAFADCKKLKQVVFEERTDSIEFGLYVFCDCRALENPILPEGITEIPDRLFSIFISSIQLPSTIENVGTFLSTCQELVIYYNGTIEQWKELASEGKVGPLARRKIICNDGELGTLKHSHPSKKWMCIDGNTVVMCVAGATGVVVVPDYVKKILDHAFSDCKKISEIRLGEGVTQICSGAFSNCTGLKKVFIPKSIRRLGKNLFKGCRTVEIVYDGTEEEWKEMDHSIDGTDNCDVSFEG